MRLILTTALAILIFKSTSAYACGSYRGRLILEDVADQYVLDIPDDIGHTEFRLLSPYTFIDCDGIEHTVPPYRTVDGDQVPTVVNGASIPPSVWTFVGGPWSGRYRNAAVIHDFLVEIRFSSSARTHRVFYEAMVASDTPNWKSSLMYYAVLKGGPYWEAGSQFSTFKEPRSVTVEELEKVATQFRSRNFSPEEIEALFE